jgi:uncharacterized protein
VEYKRSGQGRKRCNLFLLLTSDGGGGFLVYMYVALAVFRQPILKFCCSFFVTRPTHCRGIIKQVKMAYTVDSKWRNRSTFLQGREEIRNFLTGKWDREQEYRLIKEIWAHSDNRIAVRFCYEYHNDKDEWFRACGNENWEFDSNGLMKQRHASINDVPIQESERLLHWQWDAPRPEDHPGLTELGL